MLTVAKLKNLISTLDDDTPVLVPYGSHGYRSPSAKVSTALKDGRCWSEDFGVLSPEEAGTRHTAVILE